MPGRRTPAWRGGLCTGKIDETGSVTLRMAGQMHADAEQASALVDTDSEGFIAPAIQTFRVLYESETDMRSAYRSGAGAAWKDHDGALDEDIEALPLPGYRAHLVDRWIPALTGVGEKLATTGARVADVGHATYLPLPLEDTELAGQITGHACLTRWQRHRNTFGHEVWMLAGHNDTNHLSSPMEVAT